MQVFAHDQCFLFNFFPSFQDLVSASQPDVFRRQVVQAFMIPPCIIVDDKFPDPAFELAGQIIIFQQNAVLERLMPAFDLALGLGMIGLAPGMTPLSAHTGIEPYYSSKVAWFPARQYHVVECEID